MNTKQIHIIGGGFSGLVTAHALVKLGLTVNLYEQEKTYGGLIQTQKVKWGSYETAANGILNSQSVEALFLELNLPVCSPPQQGRKRFIWRENRLRQWPLTVLESLILLIRLIYCKFLGCLKPIPLETIEDWSIRCLGRAFYQRMLSPALSGVYAGDSSKMSASLILGRFFESKKKPAKPKVRGTVFPEQGMGQLIFALQSQLAQRGVQFFKEKKIEATQIQSWLENGDRIVVATSAPAAAKLLEKSDHELAQHLNQIEMLPIVTLQTYFTGLKTVPGFGALFPSEGNFHVMGVLGDHSLFPHRSQIQSERWILGGALDGSLIDSKDEDLMRLILMGRERILGRASGDLKESVVTRWPKALPHYTIGLEEILVKLKPKNRIYLIGNYLGGIGLSQILERANQLAKQIQSEVLNESDSN